MRGYAPAILPIVNRFGRAHFIVLLESRGDEMLIADFPATPVWVKVEDLRDLNQWDGSALHVCESRLPLLRLRLAAVSWTQVFLALATVLTLGALLVQPAWKRGVARRRRGAQLRGGFTAIEILIVMAVIGILCSMLVPAVQSARESARRTQCQNNLRQIGIALGNSEGAQGRYPGLNVPRANPQPKAETAVLSIYYQLLPYLGEESLFNLVDRNEDAEGWNSEPPASRLNEAVLFQSISVCMCPSDSCFPGSVSYRACAGTSPFFQTTPSIPMPNSSRQGFASGAPRLAQQIRDGLSETIFFSEKSLGDQNPARYSPSRDLILDVPGDFLLPDDAVAGCRLPVAAVVRHASFGGATWLFSCYGNTCYNHVLVPNSPTPDCTTHHYLNGQGAYTARSRHAGGVHSLFGDGSSRFINQSIDIAVWRALGTIDSSDRSLGDCLEVRGRSTSPALSDRRKAARSGISWRNARRDPRTPHENLRN